MLDLEKRVHVTIAQLRKMLAAENTDIGSDAKLSITRSKEHGERLRVVWTKDAPAPVEKPAKAGGRAPK